MVHYLKRDINLAIDLRLTKIATLAIKIKPARPANFALVSPVMGRLGFGVSGAFGFSPYHSSLSPTVLPEIAPLPETVASSACVSPSSSLSSVPVAST